MAEKQKFPTAINSGRTTRATDNSSVILNLGRGRGSYALLSRPDGTLTRAGRFFYEQTKEAPPSAAYDKAQTLIRNGAEDYIVMRSGEQRLVRSLQPDGKYKLTALGRQFFRDRYTEYVAHVPVTIEGTRKKWEHLCPG